MVALRALDLAPALLPPAAPGAPPRQLEREVLLCASRPLFLSASPTCTRLVWHGGQREVGLCDAATLTAEDGSQDDCFFVNPLPCGSQVGAAPCWLTLTVAWRSIPGRCLHCEAAGEALRSCVSHG